MAKIKAVIFDIDDTLYSFTHGTKLGMEAADAYMQKQLGIEKETFRQAVAQVQKNMGERLGYDHPAFHNRLIRFQNVLELLGKPIWPHGKALYHAYWDTLIADSTPEPGLLELLKDLKEQGIFLGIGTDMTAYIQNTKLEHLGIAQYFDGVMTSEEAGKDKPSDEIFQLCLQKAGCAPEECLFIGDNLEKDIAGAKKAGMHALWYGKYVHGETPEGVTRIDTYEGGAVQKFVEMNQ